MRKRLTTLTLALSALVITGCTSLPSSDRDGDGLPDEWEREHGLNPRDSGKNDPQHGPAGDSDGDGLSNLEEYVAHTNPVQRDSDADGLSDYEELKKTHTNPLDPADGLALLEKARQKVISRWRVMNTEPLVFTNKPGSPEDLKDLQDALNKLSGKFYRNK